MYTLSAMAGHVTMLERVSASARVCVSACAEKRVGFSGREDVSEMPALDARDQYRPARSADRATACLARSNLDSPTATSHGGGRGRVSEAAHREDAYGEDGRGCGFANAKYSIDVQSPSSPPTPSLSLSSRPSPFSLSPSVTLLLPPSTFAWASP